MGVMRRALLAASQSVWLRERAMRYGFVRRSVSRFMPGERMDDALEACRHLQVRGRGTIVTHLGENLTSAAEAESVTEHYGTVLQRVDDAGLNTQISVKLTQLGLDLDPELCYRNLMTLAERASRLGNFVWIDMEGTPYVDPTLDLLRRAIARSPNIGVCLQAYLYRSMGDLESLLPLGPAIRLVKGAYLEPAELAYPRKEDVDANFYALAARLLSDEARRLGARLGIGTHDQRLVERLQDLITSTGVSRDTYEFEMLYGIQRGLQSRLVRDGWPLRVLVSYGEYWFPWYMRRLAERPANVAFLLRSMFAR
jgi:proline dehydrogenase